MRRTPAAISRKLFLILFTLLTFPTAEAFTQEVTLDAPRTYAIYKPTGVTVSRDFSAAQITDVEGSILADDIQWVRVQIERLSDSKYWDGLDWVDQPTFSPTMIFDDSWILPSVDFSESGEYFVRLSAMNTSGDIFSPLDNGIHRIDTINDNGGPIGSLLFPLSYRVLTKMRFRRIQFSGNEIYTGAKENLEILSKDIVGVRRVQA